MTLSLANSAEGKGEGESTYSTSEWLGKDRGNADREIEGEEQKTRGRNRMERNTPKDIESVSALHYLSAKR